MTAYLEPTQAAGAALFRRSIEGPVVMMNLLRFRQWADYSRHPELAPSSPISGAAAYDLYMTHTIPHLERSGGRILFFGEGGGYLIGPADEQWDRMLLIQQRSVAAFMAFAGDADYLTGIGHRTAALEDSRLLPLVEQPVKR